MDALNASKDDDVLIETLYEWPEDNQGEKEPPGYGDMLVNLFAHNFYLGEFAATIFQPTESP